LSLSKGRFDRLNERFRSYEVNLELVERLYERFLRCEVVSPGFDSLTPAA
jgi:hypothetical protein